MLTRRRAVALTIATVVLAGCSAAPPEARAPRPAPSSAPAPSRPGATGTPSTGAPEGVDSPVGAIPDDHTLRGRGSPAIDVRHYDLAVDWDPDTGRLKGTATLDVRAAVALGGATHPTIDLDLQPFTIEGVTVDGAAAPAALESNKLRITAPTIAAGDAFTVVVRYSGAPKPVPTTALPDVSVGWLDGDRSSIVLAEPDGAHSWYPVNDHPLDKATYEFDITVPDPLWAVANGRLLEIHEEGGRRRFRWVMDAPMASYLASVVTGELKPVGEHEEGGIAYSSFVPEGNDVSVDAIPGVVDRIAGKLGPFPFATYGAVIYDDAFIAKEDVETRSFISHVALEVQGRSMYAETAYESSVVVHETAHQWFGDSVSVTDWGDDIWWVEGFATFAEDAFATDAEPATALPRDRERYESRRDRCEGTAADGLPAAELFSGPSYECGSLVFYALWSEVGDDPFWQILRTFQDRYRHGNASTQDLIDTASTVAGRDLGPFLRTWLSGDRPALP